MPLRSTDRFIAAAEQAGITVAIRRFPEGTRTAVDAAKAIGCDVAAIAKSIVLSSDTGPLVVLTSGRNRVDVGKVASVTGRTGVRQATAEEARAATGYAIGGTPPFGHPTLLEVLMDPDLLDFDEVWAAAGAPDAVFPIPPPVLREAAGATVGDVAE